MKTLKTLCIFLALGTSYCSAANTEEKYNAIDFDKAITLCESRIATLDTELQSDKSIDKTQLVEEKKSLESVLAQLKETSNARDIKEYWDKFTVVLKEQAQVLKQKLAKTENRILLAKIIGGVAIAAGFIILATSLYAYKKSSNAYKTALQAADEQLKQKMMH
jgi:hypothetical protein